MRLSRGVALLLASSLPGAGCGGLTTNTELTAGVYDLVSVNNSPPPVVLQFIDEANQVVLESGSVSIVTDGSFTDATTYRITELGLERSETDLIAGAWSFSGNRITFDPDGMRAYPSDRPGLGVTLTEQARAWMVDRVHIDAPR